MLLRQSCTPTICVALYSNQGKCWQLWWNILFKCRVFSSVCCLWLIIRSPRGHLYPGPTKSSTTQRGRRPWVDLLCPRESWSNLSDADQRENQRCARECHDNRIDPHNQSSQLSGHCSLYMLWSEQPGNNYREYQCWSSLWVFRLTITKHHTKEIYGVLLFPALLKNYFCLKSLPQIVSIELSLGALGSA